MRKPGEPCMDCGQPIKDHNKTSLKNNRCRPCHNDNFCGWIKKSAAAGTLTGARAHRNQPNFKKLLAWPAPRSIS